MKSRLSILLFFICIGCSSKNSLPDQYEIYNWRAISRSFDVIGKLDTTFVSDTLIANRPINLDSTNQRHILYGLPSELKSIENTDTIKTTSGNELISYQNIVSEFWYHNAYGLIWSVYPHSKSYPFVWSYELSEIISVQDGNKKVVNTDSLTLIIKNYRYQRLAEMEKEYLKHREN